MPRAIISTVWRERDWAARARISDPI